MDKKSSSSKKRKEKKLDLPLKGVTVRDEEYSESYDEYLECIYRLSFQNPGGWVKNKDISIRLKVKAPSVTNMLEKLSKAELIDWKPRSGIRLTNKGRDRAKEIVKNHIIIELFLQKALKMEDPNQINKIACDLEHHLTSEVSQRFMELLGIENQISNEDNLITEDKIPENIKTKKIYTESEVLSILSALQHNILNLIPQQEIHELISTEFSKKVRKIKEKTDF